MRNLLYILTICLIFSCQSVSDKKSKETLLVCDTTENREIFDCRDCEKYEKPNNYLPQINFSNDYYAINQDSLFDYYANDSLRHSIKSIGFMFFDTIPSKYKIFENVETVRLTSCANTIGLEMFPKIKTLAIFGASITIAENEKWLGRLQGFYAVKSWISGITSFSCMPRLQDINLQFSSFDKASFEFDNNKCIKNIEFYAYAGEADLTQIDFTNLKCLENVTFHTWYGPMTGIPKGIDTTRNFKLYIYHKNLTEQEKQIVNEYSK